MTPELHSILLSVRDLAGLLAGFGLLVQLGRLIERLGNLTEVMGHHQADDSARFADHGGQLRDHEQRISHLEGSSK